MKKNKFLLKEIQKQCLHKGQELVKIRYWKIYIWLFS